MTVTHNDRHQGHLITHVRSPQTDVTRPSFLTTREAAFALVQKMNLHRRTVARQHTKVGQNPENWPKIYFLPFTFKYHVNFRSCDKVLFLIYSTVNWGEIDK